MKTDLYTKTILTAIVGLLALNVFLSTSVQPVNAQATGYWIQKVYADQNGRLSDGGGKPIQGNLIGFSCYDANSRDCWAVGR